MEDIRVIVLPTGECVIVDAADYELVSRYKWMATRSSRSCIYAIAIIKQQQREGIGSVLMHRLIMNPPDGMLVDHDNGSGLDNRRRNLKICTHAYNSQNKKFGNPFKPRANQESDRGPTGFVGVSLTSNKKQYRAYISTGGRLAGKQHFLGHYVTPEEAARARDQAARYFFGDQAKLNFPNDISEAISPAELRIKFRKKKNSTSRFVGVSKGYRGRWQASIRHPESHRMFHLGIYVKEEDAALAYDRAALFLSTDRKFLNFPDLDTVPCNPEEVVGLLRTRSTLGYFGVSRKRSKFVSRVMNDGKLYRSITFSTAEEAARDYDRVAVSLGERHRLNFPEELGLKPVIMQERT